MYPLGVVPMGSEEGNTRNSKEVLEVARREMLNPIKILKSLLNLLAQGLLGLPPYMHPEGLRGRQGTP